MIHPDTIFLIDGYALIYRAFYAMIGRPLTTSGGENTSVAWGIVNFLLRLRDNYDPRYIGWVHDAGSSFRKERYPDYKATREKLDDELQEVFDASLERVEQLLAAFNVKLIEIPGYEADDVIGTLAARASEAGRDVVIVSGDKDFYQLIDERVSLLNPGRGGPAAIGEKLVTPANAAERLGVKPEFVVDYLALVGDSSDNVPGVKGIGAKTAVKLINDYGNVESIIEHAAEIKGKRPREALMSEPENARISRELVTIIRDVPLDVELEDMRVAAPDFAKLKALVADLEFHSLTNRLGESRAEAQAEDEGNEGSQTMETGSIVRSADELHELAAAVKPASGMILCVYADVEGGKSTIAGIAIGVGEESWYIPLSHTGYDSNLPSLSDESIAAFRDVVENASVPKTGHELKNSWRALLDAGIWPDGIGYDLMLAGFLAEPGRRSYDVSVLALECLGREVKSRADVVGKGKGEVRFRDVPVKTAASFACAEVEAIRELRAYFADRLMDISLQGLLSDVELPLIPVLVDMERAGIRLDVAKLAEISKRFAAELDELEREIYKEAGSEFNINSNPQLRHILFEKLQLPVTKKTKTGPSTDAGVLEQLAGMGHRLPELLLEFRELAKLRSTYVEALPQSVNPETGRIHTTFNQIGAATGRLSSHDPNLQNIPVRTPRGELIRECFVADEGRKLVIADYSQIELRLLAHLSQDRLLVEAFNRGGDIHRETAAIVFEVDLDDVTSEMRDRAKTINFATLYGQGSFALSNQLGIAKQEAQDFIDLYFERFSGVRRFLDRQIEGAHSHGYVETIFGRRRYIPELKERNFNIRSFGERLAMNSPIQGSAADLIKIAMVRLAGAFKSDGFAARMLLQVHDELVVECPDAEVNRVSVIVKEKMEGAASLSVPLVVDVGVGLNWLHAKA